MWLVVDVMTDVLVRVCADSVTVVGVEMWTTVSVNVLAAVMTALEFTMPASLKD